MAEYTFFFNPMSRAQIARWALHEAGADYEPVFVAWDAKPAALLKANPMGKLPTIVHRPRCCRATRRRRTISACCFSPRDRWSRR
jgi:hypothetical protein